MTVNISINLTLSCPSSNIPLFMSNQRSRYACRGFWGKHPPEKEMALQPRKVMLQAQRDLELSLKRRSISGKIYPRKRCQRGNFDKNTKARQPWPSQKIGRFPTGASETEKDIAIDNTLEKV